MHFRIIDLLLDGSLKYRNNLQNLIRKLDLKPLKIAEKILVQVPSDNVDQNSSLNKKKNMQWNKTEIQQKQVNHSFDHTSSREKVNCRLKETTVLLLRVTSV